MATEPRQMLRETPEVLDSSLVEHQEPVIAAAPEPTPEDDTEDRAPELQFSEDVVVLARNPSEMVQAQGELLTWAERKIQAEVARAEEAQTNLATAKKMKIRTAGWQRQADLAKRRVTFYTKVRDAVQAGYCMVPTFPVQVIAVRTKRTAPPKTVLYGSRRIPTNDATNSPTGEGRYVSPHNEIRSLPRPDENKSATYQVVPFFNEVDFPFKLAKPQILSDLDTALQQKIFDEMGVLPARMGPIGIAPPGPPPQIPDPMIIGTIKLKIGPNRERRISFLVSWWIDTSDL